MEGEEKKKRKKIKKVMTKAWKTKLGTLGCKRNEKRRNKNGRGKKN